MQRSYNLLLIILRCSLVVITKITIKSRGRKMVQHKLILSTEYLSCGQFIALLMHILLLQFFCFYLRLNSHCPITLYFVLCRTSSCVFKLCLAFMHAFPPCYTIYYNHTTQIGKFFPSQLHSVYNIADKVPLVWVSLKVF